MYITSSLFSRRGFAACRATMTMTIDRHPVGDRLGAMNAMPPTPKNKGNTNTSNRHMDNKHKDENQNNTRSR